MKKTKGKCNIYFINGVGLYGTHYEITTNNYLNVYSYDELKGGLNIECIYSIDIYSDEFYKDHLDDFETQISIEL